MEVSIEFATASLFSQPSWYLTTPNNTCILIMMTNNKPCWILIKYCYIIFTSMVQKPCMDSKYLNPHHNLGLLVQWWGLKLLEPKCKIDVFLYQYTVCMCAPILYYKLVSLSVQLFITALNLISLKRENMKEEGFWNSSLHLPV